MVEKCNGWSRISTQDKVTWGHGWNGRRDGKTNKVEVHRRPSFLYEVWGCSRNLTSRESPLTKSVALLATMSFFVSSMLEVLHRRSIGCSMNLGWWKSEFVGQSYRSIPVELLTGALLQCILNQPLNLHHPCSVTDTKCKYYHYFSVLVKHNVIIGIYNVAITSSRFGFFYFFKIFSVKTSIIRDEIFFKSQTLGWCKVDPTFGFNNVTFGHGTWSKLGWPSMYKLFVKKKHHYKSYHRNMIKKTPLNTIWF